MRNHAWTGVLSVLSSSLALVATAASPGSMVTEADFLALLSTPHPALALRREAVGAAGAEVVATSALDNPALGASLENPSGDARQVDLFVSWQLPGPERRLRVDAAGQGLAAAEAGLADDLLILRRTLRAVYADWAQSAARVELLALYESRLTDLAQRERRRADRGESSGLEARRLALAAGEARSRLVLERAHLEQTRAAARAWRPDLPADAATTLPDLPTAEPAPTASSAHHPRLRAAEARLAQSRLNRRAADRIFESPEISAGWQRQEAGGDAFTGPLLGLSWSLPAFDRKRAERALAQTHLESAEAHLEIVRRELAAQLDGAAAAFRHLRAGAGEARRRAADCDDLVAAAVAAFRLGEASVTDLLETLRATADAELAAIELHAAALAAHRDLELLTGTPARPPQPESSTPGEMP